MIRKLTRWSTEFVVIFFQTLLGMFVFCGVQGLVGFILKPATVFVFDIVRPAGTIPSILALILIFALQFWLSYLGTLTLYRLWENRASN